MFSLACISPTDSLSKYLIEIRKFRVLSKDEEDFYAKKLYDTGDVSSAEVLVTSNLRLVVKIALEHQKRASVKLMDLIQEGNIGLMLAVKKFNPYKGVRLISYAAWWIRAQIRNYLMEFRSLVKIGTTTAQRKIAGNYSKAKEYSIQTTGEENLSVISNYLDVDESEVSETLTRLSGDVYFETDDTTPGMNIYSYRDDRIMIDEQLAAKQIEDIRSNGVLNALSRLLPREKQVIEARILEDEPKTLQEIANDFGISRERVRQIEENAMKKLRTFLSSDTELLDLT